MYKCKGLRNRNDLLALCSLTTRWHEPLCSAAPCERVRELFQHPLVSRCCCQHALTACYPPRTFSQCTPHTHALYLNVLHTHTHTLGDNGRGVDCVNRDSPIITIRPVSSCSHSERGREGGRGEGQRTRVRPLACFTLCV